MPVLCPSDSLQSVTLPTKGALQEMEELNTRHLTWLKGCLSSMGRNSRINIVSKCPELESISHFFLQHLPCPVFCCFWPSHQIVGSILCWWKNWQILHSESYTTHYFTQHTHHFNGDNFQLFDSPPR